MVLLSLSFFRTPQTFDFSRISIIRCSLPQLIVFTCHRIMNAFYLNRGHTPHLLDLMIIV